MAHFGDVRDVPAALPFARGPIEVMTHPRLDENGDLINHTGGGLLAPFVDQAGLRGAGLSYGALLLTELTAEARFSWIRPCPCCCKPFSSGPGFSQVIRISHARSASHSGAV